MRSETNKPGTKAIAPDPKATPATEEQRSLFQQGERVPGVVELSKAYGTYAEVYQRCLAYFRGCAVGSLITTKSTSN
ncbi:MAG: hypothetical protein B1H03_07455 [Planctomycetales bacterium 4484_113]|nr:MAG: hypothetical protein B1H03_07455 [Planctomycetales bacterium 4484_113]